MTPPDIQEKINALEAEKRKYQQLAAFKEKLSALDTERAKLVLDHDTLAEELNQPRIGARKRSSDEEIQQCRAEILASTHAIPRHMNDIIEMLSSKYEDSTIRNQARHLTDEGKLRKLGDRGSSVMYVNAATVNI